MVSKLASGSAHGFALARDQVFYTLCNSYSTVARDLSLKTIPRPRAQPEGRAVVFNDKSHGYRAITILYPT